MPDEASKRKPGINLDESVPVLMGDGQDWYLPRPTIDVFALFSGDTAEEKLASSFGPGFDALLAASRADDGKFFVAAARLAADLLRRNYDLTDAELSEVIRFRVGDDSGAWMGAVIAVANGRDAPKASAGGSD